MSTRVSGAYAGVVLLFGCACRAALGDGVMLNDTMDVLPGARGSPWEVYDPCDGACSDYLESGRYVAMTEYGIPHTSYNYSIHVTEPPTPPPPSFFVEARYWSNSVGTTSDFYSDGRLNAHYAGATGIALLHGNAVFDFSGDDYLLGLDPLEFHVVRYESLDGNQYAWAVDGVVFADITEDGNGNGFTYVQFGGAGGNPNTPPPGIVNKWDYVRYGTISFGEIVEAADPPDGYIDPRQDRPPAQPRTLQGLDRFRVTFDEPTAVYIDQVTVESTAPAALWPSVEWVTRPDNEPDGRTVEIRLDKRLPPGHRTRFTISDEAQAAQWGQVGATSVVEYAFLPGDVNQNESVSVTDVLTLVAALNNPRAVNPLLHDINRDSLVAATDILRLVQLLNGVQTSQAWLGHSLPAWP